MESNDFTPDQPPEASAPDGIPTDRRPLGFWLRAVDRLITREFRAAFAAQGIDRRDWMLLNALSGTVDAPWLDAVASRGGKRLRALAERGWIAETDGRWTLTDDGRAAQARLAETVQGIRAKVSGAVSTDDYKTLTASLEAIARELGWDESERMPRGRRSGRGRRAFGPGFAPGMAHEFAPAFAPGFAHREGWAEWAEHRHGRAVFGPGHHRGFGPGYRPEVDGGETGFGAECGPHSARHGHPHHRPGDGHRGERAHQRGFERGFEAGYRAAASAEKGSAPASGAA